MRIKLAFNNKKRLYLGAFGGLASIFLCLYIHELTKGIVFASCFAMLSIFELKCNEKVAKVLNFTWCVLSAFVAIVLSQLLLNIGIATITYQKLFLGVLVVEFLISLLFFFTMSYRASVSLDLLVALALATVNHFVFWLRGSEFAPYDIFAASTAMNVAGNYAFDFTMPMIYAYILGALYCFVGLVMPKCKVKRSVKNSIISLAATGLVLCAFCDGSTNVRAQHFGQMGSHNNGYILNFALQFRNLSVKKPGNYSEDVVKKLEAQYQSENSNEVPEVDVIVIMSEAFGDLNNINDLDSSTVIMPFVKSLQDNTIKGHALVSGIGGGTSKSEYEFLTSNSLGLLPAGCFPFQQYVEEGSYSIVTAFEQYGFSSLGTHPAAGNNWMRSSVYPNFGFNEYYFIEDYPQKQILRNMVTDYEMFTQLIEWYESKETIDNLFLFGVTMQNHSPYDFDGIEFSNPITLNSFGHKYTDVEQYLSLLNESDIAFEKLIEYFKSIDRKVVLLVFGDHMPQLDPGFYEELYGDTFDTLEEQMLQYTVPFFIWANYDIEEQDVGLTSLNFLSNYIYEAAGLPLPAYNAFLSDVQEVIPAMNVFGYYSKDRGTIIPYDEATGTEADMLNMYRILQYNCLFDKKNRSQIFFPTAQ